ncbi:DUF1203 domain-containing protein [Rhizobiaceae bacterium LC148]|nr:DUF1203 domain-containing protein [Rhizobiaceae bacterium LC148]
MTITFNAMPTEHAAYLWSGSPDAYGLQPETRVSDGPGHPCRHCLRNIGAGEEFLVFAYRPFPELQPYAETGPIFLHKQPCERYAAREVIPPILTSPDYIVRGYGRDDRIVYGSGAVTPTGEIAARAEDLLAREDIAYVHVRSARNNCFQCRIDGTKVPDLENAATPSGATVHGTAGLGPQAIVERMFSVEMAFLASEEKDIRQLAEAFAEDVIVREPASLPYRGNWRGLDGIAALFAKMGEVWSDMKVDGLLVTGSSEEIHLSCNLTMVSRATGRTVIQPFCERLRFRDGRLIEGIPFYYDTQELLEVITQNAAA